MNLLSVAVAWTGFLAAAGASAAASTSVDFASAGHLTCDLETRVEVIKLDATFDTAKDSLALSLSKFHPSNADENFNVNDELAGNSPYKFSSISKGVSGNTVIFGYSCSVGALVPEESASCKTIQIGMDSALHLTSVNTSDGVDGNVVKHSYDVNTGSGQHAACTISQQAEASHAAGDLKKADVPGGDLSCSVCLRDHRNPGACDNVCPPPISWLNKAAPLAATTTPVATEHTCTDIDSDSNYVLKAKTLEGIPEVTLEKLSGFNGQVVATGKYNWSGGSELSQPSSPLIDYSAYFYSESGSQPQLPDDIALDYVQTSAKEFPDYLLLKLDHGGHYDVFKLVCSASVSSGP